MSREVLHGRRQLVPQGVLLSQATSETCIHNCQQQIYLVWAHCEDCLRKKEEGAGYGRSVWSESAGLHARNNGMDNGLQLREGKPILETIS